MKRIKFLMVAFMAAMMGMGLSSCSKDDNESSNYEKYQKQVDDMVKQQKKNDKVILLVAFGSTW